MEKGEMGENATGRLTTYYVAECMEFNRYGEYREDIHSAEEAVKIYQSIPSERLNAGKGIGLHVEEEDGIPLEFSLVYNGELDVDLLRDIYDQNQYPEVFIAARELSAYLPETKVIDTKGLLTEKTLEATVFADEMIKLEKNLDPDFYHTFYPKEAEHKEAIIWKALCQDGKEEYSRWLGSKIFEQKSVLKEQADKLKTTLEQVKLIPPVDLKPFVYVRISEHPDIPLEEAMPLNQAVELFGKLDRQSVEEKDMAGYYKTHFEICFLSEGEVMSYTGRQDFGDGEGNLLDHVKAFADYYLHTEEGQQLMKQTARTTEEWEHEQQQMRWVLEEMLPTITNDGVPGQSLLTQEKRTKTHNSVREVPIADFVVDEIILQRRHYEELKELLGEEFHDLGYLICQDNGLPWNRSFKDDAYKRVVDKCGFKFVQWRKLRTTYATVLAQYNVSMKAISSSLGHYSTDFTKEVYVKSKRKVIDLASMIKPFADEILYASEDSKSMEMPDVTNYYRI